jgi:hypothetical protein
LASNTSDKDIWLLIKNVAELEKGYERGTFEAALKEADIDAIEARSERQHFPCQVSCFAGTAELFAKNRTEPG